MLGLRNIARILLDNSKYCGCISNQRYLNYSPIFYESDPTTTFFNDDIQKSLKSLTRINYDKVFRVRRLGGNLRSPTYKFLTDEELQAELNKAKLKAEKLLQIPPIVKVRRPEDKVLSKDPALQGLDTARIVFTDITFGVNHNDRLIVVREPDGTLRHAEDELRHRLNQVYFPEVEKQFIPPQMFNDENLERLLDQYEYEFILDRACLQFEPYDLAYQKIVSITYQHINDKIKFDLLRSTRHFGSMVFFYVWNKDIDNLLLELIETSNINEAEELIRLYVKIHQIDDIENNDSLELIEEFINKFANKKSSLELAIQSYKEFTKQRQIN